MANNTAGTKYSKWLDREARLIDKIDRRDKSGKNMENTDNTYNNYRVVNGERVWSF